VTPVEYKATIARMVLRRRVKWAGNTIAVLTLLLAGCHTMRFELVEEPSAETVTERKAFFLWGLVPTQRIDVRDRCPAGVVALRERTTFIDGLLSLPTLGIYKPRSTIYFCRAPQ
jgi:hypothetical protein